MQSLLDRARQLLGRTAVAGTLAVVPIAVAASAAEAETLVLSPATGFGYLSTGGLLFSSLQTSDFSSQAFTTPTGFAGVRNSVRGVVTSTVPWDPIFGPATLELGFIGPLTGSPGPFVVDYDFSIAWSDGTTGSVSVLGRMQQSSPSTLVFQTQSLLPNSGNQVGQLLVDTPVAEPALSNRWFAGLVIQWNYQDVGETITLQINSLNLTAIPEPGTAMLLTIAAPALLARRRRV